MEYGDEIREYMVHFRPLWDWTLSLLSDSTLSSFFVWDAVKIFQLDEKTNTRMRIFDEPWTGDLLWKIQVYCFSVSNFVLLTIMLELTTAWWKAIGIYYICRQNMPIIIWDSKRISSHGTYC